MYAVIDGEQVSVLTINVSKPSPMIRSLQIANDSWIGMLQDFIVMDFYPDDLQNNIEYFSGLTGTLTVEGRAYALETWPVEVEGTDYIAVALNGSLTGNTDILVAARTDKTDSFLEFDQTGMFIKTHNYYYKKASSQPNYGNYSQMIPYKLETFSSSTPIQLCGMKMVCDSNGNDYVEIPLLPTSFSPGSITDITVNGQITIRGAAYWFELSTERVNGRDKVIMSINGRTDGWTNQIMDAVSSDDTFVEFQDVSISTSNGKNYVPANGQDMSGLYYDIFPFYLQENSNPDVPVVAVDHAPTYDFQIGSIDLSGAVTSSSPVTLKVTDGNGNVKSTLSLGSTNKSYSYGEVGVYYVASNKTVYYYTNNGKNINYKNGKYTFILSQANHSDIEITPQTKRVYYTIDYPFTGSPTEPTITIDNSGDDVIIPVYYKDVETGLTYSHSLFDAPAILRNAFKSDFSTENRYCYLDYTDDSTNGSFRYDVNTDFDDVHVGYITINGLHQGRGYINFNSSDGVYPCQDLLLQINVNPYPVEFIEFGNFDSEYATIYYDDILLIAKTIGNEDKFLPKNVILRHIDSGIVPQNKSAAKVAWENSNPQSDFLKNISTMSSNGNIKMTDPTVNGGWYACGPYVGKISKTNRFTNEVFESFYSFQITQHVTVGLGVAFDKGTGSASSVSFNFKSNFMYIYPVFFMHDSSKENAASRAYLDNMPRVYAKFNYSDITNNVNVKTVQVPDPATNEGDYYDVSTKVYGDTDWFQISGTWRNYSLRLWNVTSSADTKRRVTNGFDSNAAFRSGSYNHVFSLSFVSNSNFSDKIWINDNENTNKLQDTNGGWWCFLLDGSLYHNAYSTPTTIEMFYNDWSNY